MAEFRVTWEIDVDANDPEAAAWEAFCAMQRQGTTATVFKVVDPAAPEKVHTFDVLVEKVSAGD